jgi:HD-GYP domain-containing protein (c-di-GMP phosphodiesterase class II)
MNRIARSQLREGIFITRETFLDEKFVLLSPEIPVDEELLERLRRWQFDYVFSDGSITEEAPAVGGGVAATEDAPFAAIDQGRQDAQSLKEAHKQYMDLLHFAEQLFGNFLQNNILPMQPIHDRMKTLQGQLRDQRRFLLRIPELNPGHTNYIVDHAVKTAIVAVATASSMKMPPHRLIDVGTAALLHEIGMIRLPSQLYMSDRQLTPKEKKAITTSPVLGFKVLRQFNYPMQVCLAVLESRENLDGSGYPRGITGDKLSQYAKILNPASTFAAMASTRPYRAPIDGHTIMKTLLTGQNSRYDKEVLQAMVGTFSLFPYGTFVQLASGNRAVVIDITPGNPRNPTVRLVTDREGIVISEQPVVDTTSEQYSVTGVLAPDEVKKLRDAM